MSDLLKDHTCGGSLCKAKATVRGYVHPKTGELLKNRKFSEEYVTAWNVKHGFAAAPVKAPVTPVIKAEVADVAAAEDAVEVVATAPITTRPTPKWFK